MTNFKTKIISRAEVVDRNSDAFRAVASEFQDKYGFEIKPQMDLLYVRSCLVSAGEKHGVNDNDDIFTREEAWAARFSPVLKPFNWQHNDKDIVGVIYSVQARDIDGNILDLNDDTPPEKDFDLWTEAAVFSLVHSKRAKEIKERAKSGDLFVSMEAWFDSYDYGLCNESGEELEKVLARNSDTSFLDTYLKFNRGSGSYENRRIGRLLRGITFGGCGFVDRPANKRSDISDCEQMLESVRKNDIDFIINNKIIQEEDLMNANASKSDLTNDVRSAVAEELEAREAQRARAAEFDKLQAKAEESERKAQELEKQLEELKAQHEESSTNQAEYEEKLAAFEEAVDSLVDSTKAGATDSTPPEIAAIDAATDGEAAFRAKIDWVTKSMASLQARASRADELEAELAKAAAAYREQEVRAMFADVLPEDTIDILVTRAADLDEDGYEDWKAEKQLLILDAAEAKMDYGDKDKKKKMKDKMKHDKEDKTMGSEEFRSLLRQRLEAMEMTHLINHPGGEDVKSGVPAEMLRTQRFKVAGGAAGEDAAQSALDNAQAESGLNLAGAASVGDDGEGVNPFRSLASELTGVDDEDNNDEKKPGFDPIQ